MDEELIVDAEGIPILTALVHEHETAAPEPQPADETAESAAVIADSLLQKKSFKKQLERLTATLSQQLIEQVEQSLRPAIEQAISLSLEDSHSHSATAIRQQLEQAL
ncbi:MAG: hypothetical protein OEU48_07340, partial [Gammaproteobacteria bacterium]|nr:hypothetical protein [Gammaproteobacteria bacterium]